MNVCLFLQILCSFSKDSEDMLDLPSDTLSTQFTMNTHELNSKVLWMRLCTTGYSSAKTKIGIYQHHTQYGGHASSFRSAVGAFVALGMELLRPRNIWH